MYKPHLTKFDMTPPQDLITKTLPAPQFPASLYRELMQLSAQALLILDQYTILDCNPSAARLFGLSCAQLINTSVFSHSPLQQAAGHTSLEGWNEFLQSVDTQAKVRFAWVFQRPDGSLLSTQVALSHCVQEGKNWALAEIRDSGNPPLTASALLAKQSQLQTLLDNFPGGISIIDESLRFVAWNKQMLSLTGYTEAVFRPEAPPSLMDILRLDIERGEYGQLPPNSSKQQVLDRWMARARSFEPYFFEKRRANGSVLEVRGVPIEGGGFVSIYQDVTEQHQIKEALQKQSLLLQEVLHHMSAGIAVFDGNLRLEIWNSTVMEMLDLPMDSFRFGIGYEDVLRMMLERGEFGDVDIEQEVRKRMVVVRRFHGYRFERTRLNGRTFLIHGKAVLHEGKVAEFVTTWTEITDRKQAENTLKYANARLEKLVQELNDARAELVRSEKLVALGSLVAGVAHELNTPLGNCLMMVSAMQELTEQVNAKLNERGISKLGLINYFNQVEDAVDFLNRNLNSVGDLIQRFKQATTTEASLQRSTFSVEALASEVESLTRSKVQAGEHHLRLEIEAGLEMNSYFGPLEQVLVNFVNNSLLHAFYGLTGGTMYFAARRGAGERVLIEFRDDGCGIEKKNLGRIFDPFFTTRMGQGSSGLGLQICHNIITSLLGGEIRVQSELGLGTTFTLNLPLYAPDNH